MNPEHITARNFRSWRRLDLDLPSGCVAISGVNGAGKSSILLAVELALFAGKGELARHFSRDPDGDTVVVEVLFEHDGDHYRVRRAWSERARKGALEFDRFQTYRLAPGESITLGADNGPVSLTRETAAETQILIERTLGLDRRTYRASSYIAQGDGAAFTAAQPRDRKDILADILGLKLWDRLSQTAKADRLVWTERVDMLRGRLQQMDEQLTEMPGVIDQLRMAREGLAEDEALIANLRSEVAQAGEQLEAARVAERMVEVRQTAFDVARRATEEANRQHERLRTQIREAREQDVLAADRSLADRLPALEAEQMGVWEAQKAWREREGERLRLWGLAERAHALLERTRAEVDYAESIYKERVARWQALDTADTCPTCGQTLPAEARDEAIRDAESAVAQAADRVGSAINIRQAAAEEHDLAVAQVPDAEPEPEARAELLDLIKQCQKLAERAARADERLAMAARWQVEADEVNQRVAELTATQIEAEVALNRVQSVHDPKAMARAVRLVEQAESALQIAERRVAEQRERLAVLDERSRLLASVAAEREAAVADLLDAQNEAAAARLLERAYGRNGVPALIMEQSAIPAIEQTANRVLADLGTSFTTQLRTQRILRSGDTADALDVVVHTPDGEALYEDLSGGERTRVDVALRLGLAELLAHRSGAEVRLLAMDEPAHLDDEGMQRLAGILERLGSTFDRILLVSHVPALADAFDQRIIVTRDATGASIITGAAEAAVTA